MMKKRICFILATALLFSALFCIGIFTASATESACTESGCTGSYVNGICSENAAHYQPAVQNGVGANGQPLYEISNAGQLFWFAAQVNGGNMGINATLTADITVEDLTFTFIPDTGLLELKHNGAFVAYIGTKTAGDDSGENENFDLSPATLGALYADAENITPDDPDLSAIRMWTPIGNDAAQYTGTFEGNGKTVSGLFFHNAAANYVGLFGGVGQGGTIRNVGVDHSYFYGAVYIGGVAGQSKGSVSNCYNTGCVNGQSMFIGGVVGDNFKGNIANCYNTGSVNALGPFLGGVVGYNTGTITGSYNTGNIDGNDNTGGVVGNNAKTDMTTSSVTGCYNTGNVIGWNEVGGVAGYSLGTVTNSYNTGNVTGAGSEVGGVIGTHEADGVTTNCYNTGEIRGGNHVGGVVGFNSASDDYTLFADAILTSCYNTGNVYGTNTNIGGVVGNNGGKVAACYNTGNVRSTNSHVGGVVGYNTNSVINCYNTGNVNGSFGYIGGVIGRNEDTVTNCYYLSGTANGGINSTDAIGKAQAKTAAEFASGTVAVLLNGSVLVPNEPEALVWGQTLMGEQRDASPVFLTENNRIYFGYTTCDAAQTAPIYSNVSTAAAEKPTHNMAAATCTAPSTCTVCAHTEGEALGHKMAAATCTAPSTCTVCAHTEGEALGHRYDNVCDADCNVCGELRTPSAHVYDNGCDTSCNVCNTARTVGEHLDSDGNDLCDHCNAEVPKDGLSGGAIAGIATGGTTAVGIGSFCVFWFVIKKRKWSDLVGIFKK